MVLQSTSVTNFYLYISLIQGINRQRVEQMESRLKEDVLLEAARFAIFLPQVFIPTI